MTIAIKSLGDGQLAAGIGDLYEAPTATQALVKSITQVNTHSSALTVNLYFKASGQTARRIIPKDYSLAASAKMEAIEDSITLEAGDKIQGSGGTASKVDYVISGVENS